MIWLKKLQQNLVFKYLSSVRLAIPLLIVVSLVIGAGTIVESRYNTELARLIFYDSSWFLVLLVLLWINIFCATISRYPFQKHHTGFVVTHIGLLTLLIGAMITGVYGIDGQLRVEEGSRNQVLVLPELVLEKSEYSSIDGKIQNHAIVTISKPFFKVHKSPIEPWGVKTILPFSEVKEEFVESKNPDSGLAVGIFLKSPFFSVGEVLHSQAKPKLNLGPAQIELKFKTSENQKKIGNDQNDPRNLLLVKDKTSGKVIAQFSLQQLQKGAQSVGKKRIRLVKSFEQALVGKKSEIYDGGQANVNPALQLEISDGKAKVREVAFAKFRDFSINSDGALGLVFEYQRDEVAPLTEVEPMMSPNGRPMGTHLISLIYDVAHPDQIQIEFRKDGKVVATEKASSGATVTSPWMGMTLGIGSLMTNAAVEEKIVAAEVKPGEPLPRSSVELHPPGFAESFWLMEDESRDFFINGKKVTYYYGPRSIELPFTLNLKAFTKKDYLGTETPMSFESEVVIDQDQQSQKISMNEPMKRAGFTIYQSSYELHPGRPTASIFSVNKDPGRPWKYVGSLILGIGIITFTLMRSRFYRKKAS